MTESPTLWLVGESSASLMHSLHMEGIEFAEAATPEELAAKVSTVVPLAVLVNRDHTENFFNKFSHHRLIEVREFAIAEAAESLRVHVRGLIGAIRRFHELQAAESVAWSEIAGDDVISTDFFGQAILEIFACRTKREIEKQLREVLERIGAIAELAIFTDPPMAPLSDLGKFQLAVPLQNGGILEAHAYVAFPKYSGEEAERIASRVAGALLGLADSVALAIARNRALESSQARVHLWESSFEAVADPIVLVSGEAKIRRSNSAFAKVFGQKAVVGEPLRIFPDEELALMLRIQISEYEYQWGANFYRVFVSRVSAGQEANGVLFRFRDETRERALRDRIRARKQAVDLGILIGSVAHEINNPIGGILIYAQMLLASDDLPPQHRQDIKVIEDSAKRIKQIVQTMLALVRRSDGKKVAVSLTNCLDEVLNLLEPEIRRAKVKVLREYSSESDSIKELFVVRNSVLQMLFHLLQEVVQRSAAASDIPGGAEIEIKLLDSERDLILEIYDSGPAISQIAESSVAVSVVRLLLEEQDARLESLRSGERNQLRLSFRRDIVL